MPPERLGPYRILETLGRGGMGAVYHAINEETDEHAAVKILSASLADDPDFRQRFEAEIETLRKLRHPNIVRLFGFGEEDGQLFYAMELVEGCSLEQELRQRRQFGWREVADVGLDVCRALRHAHDRGIIHRDIKPANLLLATDGKVKLLDFGIARLFGYSRLTAAGNVLGTLDYMAPEQADDRPTGPRTDLYSLGGVLYALLVGRPPFQAKSLAAMLELQRTVVPEPVSRYARDVPRELEQIIARLLEKDPQKRVATATVLHRQIEAMVRRLTLSESALKAAPAEPKPADFEQGPTVVAPEPSQPNRLPETNEATAPARPPPAQGLGGIPADELPETKGTEGFAGLAGGGAEEQDASQSGKTGAGTKTTSRFVRVEEEDLDRFEIDEPTRGALISAQTWVLAIGLVLIGATAWYLLQDPSADTLYERIVNVTAEGTIGSYRRAEDDINRFIALYSDDSRSALLREHLKEIDLNKLESKFELQAKGLLETDRLLPIQRDYLEAIKHVRLDPDVGMVKLEALVDLYDTRGDDTGPTGQCIMLANRRLSQLRHQLELMVGNHLATVIRCLDRADRIDATDKDRARRMRQAVIELYEHKPWASEAVDRAREALDAQGDSW